jgi:hypothetical protein
MISFSISRITSFLAIAIALSGAIQVSAQWVEQRITLRPGWNAIFVEVASSPRECDSAFAGLPIESVWDWNGNSGAAQFVQDPTTLVPGGPDWLTWFAPSHALREKANLVTLRDGRAYLVKLADNAPLTTVTLVGKPSLRSIDWRAGSLNFVGFPVGTNSAPTFATIFAGEQGLAGQPIFRLGANGVWARVADPATTRPKGGEAYWVRCNGPAIRSGTIEVDSGSREGLRFERGVAEQSIRIRNTSTSARNISVRALTSAVPPAGEAAYAGAAPIEYREANFAQLQFGWKPLSEALSFSALAPGAEWNVRLAVRHANLPPTGSGAEFQSIIEVTDDLGTRRLVPVTVDNGDGATGGSASADSQHAGLWMGEAVVDAVSQPAQASDGHISRPAGGKFQFRLIVHVDGSGNAKLLKEAFVVRKPPTFKADPANPDYQIVDQPARTVVLTDEALIPQVIGNGEVVGRRTSTAAFAFKEPRNLSGSFGAGTLNAEVSLDYDNPLNPFRHTYHPDHNNLDERFEQKLPEGKEAFTVARNISLQFTDTDPLGLNPPGWGDTELGGNYSEVIQGLHQSAIRVSGTFRLIRVAPTAVLNQ